MVGTTRCCERLSWVRECVFECEHTNCVTKINEAMLYIVLHGSELVGVMTSPVDVASYVDGALSSAGRMRVRHQAERPFGVGQARTRRRENRSPADAMREMQT
eukprot:COSAG02_NODE_81_length_39811_cov_51.728898_35_plen_103_part_00